MSAAGSGEILKPILMRSSTPAPNEKVLKYLDGMSREELDDPDDYRSNHSGSSRRPSRSGLHSPRSQNANHLRGDDDDDVRSDVQQRSENGTALPVREPSPHDPPGPHYESYDSGPSFGNLGPLPVDDYPAHTGYTQNTWAQPPWDDDDPNAQIPWNLDASNPHDNNTPGYARIPLPESVASPRATSIAIGVESPSSRNTHKLLSRASEKPSSEVASQAPPTSPKSTVRAPSRGDGRPLSPLSLKSRATGRSKATDKGTVYPPLPESRVGDDEMLTFGAPLSPTQSRAPTRSKAPSVAPSDSLSQVYNKRSRAHSRQEGSNVNRSEAGNNGAEFSPRSGSRQIQNGHAPMSPTGFSHQSRPFSPYRHAPTTEDLLNAAARGRALVIPEEDEPQKPPSVKQPSVVPSKISKTPSAAPSAAQSHRSRQSGTVANGKSSLKQSSIAPSQRSQASRKRDSNATPTPARPQSPEMDELNQEEARIVEQALASAARTPRTSFYTPSALDAEVAQSNFHDLELCILLHQLKAPQTHELVRKVVLKAVKQRMKKLSMKYDNESIKQYSRAHHNHDPISQLPVEDPDEPPRWAADLKREILLMQQRIESLGPKIENLRPPPPQSFDEGDKYYDDDEYTHTPATQTVNIHTQATGTMAESMYQPETEMTMEDAHPGHQFEDDGEFEHEDDGEMTEMGHRGFPAPTTDQTHTPPNYAISNDRDDSPGQQYLEEELYKLRQRPSKAGAEETTWDVQRSDADEGYGEEHAPVMIPTIAGSETGDFDKRSRSPPLPPIPQEVASQRSVTSAPHLPAEYNNTQGVPPWQKIHQRLLSWAIIWRFNELDEALNSTTRGHQVNEVAMSIWSTQTYKRYVRSRMTDTPQGVVDRLFVPPNMADAISNAVFNGRHGDASDMLRDLWTPFGLQGMPRLLVVLAKHRSDENHWVVHRFSLPDGGLTTYDSYPERTLPDGRPLGWWFAIRVAWPNAIYPSPDHLIQKMVRLHRPMQLPIDNSVAAGGIWRNILMGSRAERSLDLERLRDLINTEVKNLRTRKHLGKLSINAPRPSWEDMS